MTAGSSCCGPSSINRAKLSSRFAGEVVGAGEEAMLLANKQFAAGKPLAIPQLLLRCTGVDDVRCALDFVREQGIAFAVRSGGHCFADLSSHTDVVIDLGAMNACALDGARARIGPGINGCELAPQLAQAGRSMPTGGCPLVAIGGLTLVGGFGFLGRRHGLASDRVLHFQMVAADGRVCDVDRDREPELFWALRGAGAGGFGIVTEVTLDTVPAAEFNACFAAWPMDAAADIIEAWQHWAPLAGDSFNLELSLIAPEDPQDPCFLKLYGIVLCDADDAGMKLDQLRTWLGRYHGALRTWHVGGEQAARYLSGLDDHQGGAAWQPCFPYPGYGFQFTQSDFFDAPVSREAIGDLIDCLCTDRCYPQGREVELIPWGGAYAQANVASCFTHRQAQFMARHTAIIGARATPELHYNTWAWAQASRATLSGYANGHVYQGYADWRMHDWRAAYYGDAYARLRRVKREYDPENLFRHPQSIEPAEA